MYILGDIGNSDTKIFIVNSKNRILSRIIFSSKKINHQILYRKLKFILPKIKKVKKNIIL